MGGRARHVAPTSRRRPHGGAERQGGCLLPPPSRQTGNGAASEGALAGRCPQRRRGKGRGEPSKPVVLEPRSRAANHGGDMTRGARERAYRRADAQGHTHAPEAYGRATGPQGRHRRGGRGRYSRRVFAPSRPKGEITPKNLFTARTSPGQIGFPKPNADAPKGRDHAFLSRDFF